MKKAFAYARFSTDMQREESIEAQFRAIKEYCSRNKISLINFFKDEGISGTTDNRPAFQEMIKKAEEVDYIIVHKLDRFSRNKYDSAIYKRALHQKGVRVISVLENLDNSPESIILESVLEGMSEYYSKNLSREVKKGSYENAYKAKFNGGVPLFGYSIDENKNYIINEYQAIAVRLIFEMFSKGHSYSEIITELNKRGYKTNKGNNFKKTTLHDLLCNERYVGTYVFSREDYDMENRKRNSHKFKNRNDMIIVENGNPAIIDKKTWELVKERQTLNKKISNKAKWTYVLSPFLYCNQCGKKMSGFTRKNKIGKYYQHYRCINTSCEQKSVRTDILESEFYDAFNKLIFNDSNKQILVENINNFIKMKNSNNDNSKIENELKEIEQQLNNAVAFILNGSSSQTIKNKIEELEQKKYNLQNEIIKNSQKHDSINSNEIIKFLNKYDKLEKFNISEQQTILKFFIDQLRYEKGKLIIKLKLAEKPPPLKNNENGTELPAPFLLSQKIIKINLVH